MPSSISGRLELDEVNIGRPSIEYGRDFSITLLSKVNLDEEALAAQMFEVTICAFLVRSRLVLNICYIRPLSISRSLPIRTSSPSIRRLKPLLIYFLEQACDHFDVDPSDDSVLSSSRTSLTPSILSSLPSAKLLSYTHLRLIASMFSQMCEAIAVCHDTSIFHHKWRWQEGAQPEEARILIPDPRFEWLCNLCKPASRIPAFLTCLDIAGLIFGASSGAGLGNAFLSHVHAVDGIFQVVRAFDDSEVIHVEGDVDPLRDMEIIKTELRLKDIEWVQKSLENLKKSGRSLGSSSLADKARKEEIATIEKVLKLLTEEKKDVRKGDWTNKESIIVVRVLLLWNLDGFLFGGIRLRLFGGSGNAQAQKIATTSAFSIARVLSIATFGIFSGKSYAGKDAHLLGQHTVRTSLISTAFLNPFGQTFCLPTPSNGVSIPLLLNNTSPQTVEYFLTPLGYVEGKDAPPQKVVVHSRELRAIENARAEELRRVKGASRLDTDDYDYDEGDEDEEERDPHSTMRLQKTQCLFINGDAITRGDNVRCAAPGVGGIGGEDRDFQLSLNVYGVPPVSFKWFKDINGKREYFTVEGIQGKHVDRPDGSRPSIAAAQDVYIPLTVSAEALGMHTYALESVMVPTPPEHYMSCVGRLSRSRVAVLETLPPFVPWDVTIEYQPSPGLDENGKSANKRFRPWKKILTTQEVKRDLAVKTNTPGEYTIVDVKGNHVYIMEVEDGRGKGSGDSPEDFVDEFPIDHAFRFVL
ncbi:hypothetical protein EW146_g10202 [Bondarzewia mesenterica]|uniref:Nucleoporin POM152 first Ig-like domain-containing protein n=1 Tax=Bondarzewia mesenterica TaxID=1095465 RepID=A0A4S4KZP4_9AGAM|nr:hypothetical protein EW146_g10202 [Bondarzewia mesenterica]